MSESSSAPPLASRAIDAAAAVMAVAAVLLLGVRAVVRFDPSWDGTAYHLVLAAFRAGILTHADLVPAPVIATFDDFVPPLLYILRGYLWRITGSIPVLQTFNLAAIVALAAFWHWRFALSLRWALLAILAVPLIQIGATTLYVDTFANCLFAIPLTALTAACIDRRPLIRSESVVALIALSLASNAKPQFVILSTVLLAVLCLYQVASLAWRGERGDLRFFLALAVVAWLVVPSMAVRNAIVHGSPFYPLTVAIAGYELPGVWALNQWEFPDYLARAPQPIRWLASILEFRAFDGRYFPYSIDQGATVLPGGPKPPSFRMGGYFVPFVLGLLAWLLIFARHDPARERLRWFLPVALTSLIAFLPGSHELRYYSFWMLNLIFLGLLAARRAQADGLAFRSFLLVAFLSVGLVTGFRYFDPTPYSVQDHIRAQGIDRAVDGRDICFEYRNRDPILFTWIFHAAGRYRVVDMPPGERCPPK